LCIYKLLMIGESFQKTHACMKEEEIKGKSFL